MLDWENAIAPLFPLASQQAALPARLFKDVRLCDFVVSQDISNAILLTTLLAAAHFHSPPAAGSGVLLSSLLYPARQAVSLQ